MDPLTHTLVGANLASSRLGKTSRLAPAALVIGANVPDLDVLAYAAGADAALGFRRGWTHGILALVVLPVALTALLLLWGRLRAGARPAPELRGWWLLTVSALAVLTHPTLDWLNTYGMRWLMPFGDSWSYGDALFIMDPWLWLILGGTWLAGRRRRLPALGLWVLFAGLIAWVVAWRAPGYLPAVAFVALALLAALLWRPRGKAAAPRGRLAAVGLSLAALYIVAMLALQGVTERRVEGALAAAGHPPGARLMVGPTPLDPLTWDVVAEVGDRYLSGTWGWWGEPGLRIAEVNLPVPRAGFPWDRVRRSPEIRGFISWVRFPWIESEPGPSGLRVYIMDARYARRRTTGFGGALVEIGEGRPTGAAAAREGPVRARPGS